MRSRGVNLHPRCFPLGRGRGTREGMTHDSRSTERRDVVWRIRSEVERRNRRSKLLRTGFRGGFGLGRHRGFFFGEETVAFEFLHCSFGAGKSAGVREERGKGEEVRRKKNERRAASAASALDSFAAFPLACARISKIEDQCERESQSSSPDSEGKEGKADAHPVPTAQPPAPPSPPPRRSSSPVLAPPWLPTSVQRAESVSSVARRETEGERRGRKGRVDRRWPL